VFSGHGSTQTIVKGMSRPTGMCNSWLDLSNRLSSVQNKDCMQKLRPQEVGIPTNPIGAHKPFGVSSPRVGFLDFYGFLIVSL
jgi:hypothetical protein